jgi:hypothetical protein
VTVRLPDSAVVARVRDVPTDVPGHVGSGRAVVPSVQYDLFARFLGHGELSNTIELWDAIPKYSFSARMQALTRDGSGRLPVYQRVFEHHPAPKSETPTWTCALTLQPASIDVGGRWIDVYPSVDVSAAPHPR